MGVPDVAISIVLKICVLVMRCMKLAEALKMISACWRAPMNMTAITYNAGCKNAEQRAITTAIETHSPAVA
jgi:hypothetical protein